MTAAYRYAAGLACGTIAALIWAGGAVVTRHLVTTRFAAIDLVLLRYIGCFPVAILALAFWNERCRLDISWPRFAVLLLLAGPPYQFLITVGYKFTTACGGTLLISGLLPVFSLAVVGLSSRTVPAAIQLIGALLATAGIALFTLVRGEAQAFTGSGLAIFAVAALLWAILNQLVRSWHVSPWRLTVALAAWSPVFLPLYVAFSPVPISGLISRDGMIQLAYHGWLVAFIATLLFFSAVRFSGVITASILQALSPGFSALLGAALLDEAVMPLQMVAIGLTMAGVALVAYLVGTTRPGATEGADHQ